MDISRIIRRICFPIFLATTALTVVLACCVIWSETESLVLWKLAGSALVVSTSMALILSATRVTFDSPD